MSVGTARGGRTRRGSLARSAAACARPDPSPAGRGRPSTSPRSAGRGADRGFLDGCLALVFSPHALRSPLLVRLVREERARVRSPAPPAALPPPADCGSLTPMPIPRAVADNLWVIDDLMSFPLGVRMPIRATVVRLADGALWVHSPTPLTPELGADVEALGPVRDLIAPSRLHHRWLAPWAARFPQARLWAAPGFGGEAPRHLVRRRARQRRAAALGGRGRGAANRGRAHPRRGRLLPPREPQPAVRRSGLQHPSPRHLDDGVHAHRDGDPGSLRHEPRLAPFRARSSGAEAEHRDSCSPGISSRVIPAHGEVFDGDGGDARAATRTALAWMLR